MTRACKEKWNCNVIEPARSHPRFRNYVSRRLTIKASLSKLNTKNLHALRSWRASLSRIRSVNLSGAAPPAPRILLVLRVQSLLTSDLF